MPEDKGKMVRIDIYKEVIFLKQGGASIPFICKEVGVHQARVNKIINHYESLMGKRHDIR